MHEKIVITPVKIVCKRDCPDRAWDCHGKCPEYSKYRAKCDAEMHKRNLERDVSEAIGLAMKRIPGKREI